MSQRSKRTRGAVRWLLSAAALVVTGGAGRAHAAAMVEPPFNQDFILVNLGAIDNVHPPYGAITFVPGDPDSILTVAYAGTQIATFQAAALTRDSTGTISGFAGPAITAIDAYAAQSGAAYGPGGVLFYTTSTIAMGEVKPGSAVTDKAVNLRPISPYSNITGINFVPPGLGGAGTMKAVGYSYGDWWSFSLTPDQNGTYDVTGQLSATGLQGYPSGFTYVAPGGPGPMSPGLLLCERELGYGLGKVVRYDVDTNGNPITATRHVVVSGLDVPEGIAVDPSTGDVVFTSYQGWVYVLRHAPLPPTTTTTSTTTSTSTTKAPTTTTSSSTTLRPTTTVVPTTTTSTTRAPTTTTSSSTTLPTTSTTAAPTTSTTSTTKAPTTTTSSSTTTRPSTSTTVPPTTSTTVPPTTTSSTTVHSTTSTTSTTVRPTTTTSSTSSTTVSTSTVTTSSTTTTTLPSACGVDPSFEWIGCGVDALLALVRSSSDLGPLQPTFVAKLEQAAETVDDGATSCAAGQGTLARRALERLGRQMLLVRARTRTLRARKTIPRPLAERIANDARAIAADARALRGALECP